MNRVQGINCTLVLSELLVFVSTGVGLVQRGVRRSKGVTNSLSDGQGHRPGRSHVAGYLPSNLYRLDASGGYRGRHPQTRYQWDVILSGQECLFGILHALPPNTHQVQTGCSGPALEQSDGTKT